MHLAKSFESGLAIIIMIARQPENHAISAAKLVSQLDISLTYSQKLLRKLVVAELIKSTPGNGGGFVLAKPASAIKLSDVILALEGQPKSFVSGAALRALDKHYSCATTQQTERAFQTADLVWMQVLSQTSLSDLNR